MRDYASTGKHPGLLPTPGVYARHNAVDTPALLPDGSDLADISVSRSLQARGVVRTGSTTDVDRTAAELEAALDPGAPSAEPRRAGSGGVNTDQYLTLSTLLFTIGAVGVLVRRNAIVVFMCVELMLNAANLAFVSFSRAHGQLDGQVAAFFVMVVAAAEVVVGLADHRGHLPFATLGLGRRRQSAEVLKETPLLSGGAP